MSDGKKTIDIIRVYVNTHKKIPAALKDELLFGSLVDLYDKVDDLESLRPWTLGFKWSVMIGGGVLLVAVFSAIIGLL